MSKENFDKVKQEVKKMVLDITELPAEQLSEEAKFVEDLGVDSMKAIEIVACIEKKYKVVVPEDEVGKMRSLKDVYVLLEKLIR